jgi:hypothetical protein
MKKLLFLLSLIFTKLLPMNVPDAPIDAIKINNERAVQPLTDKGANSNKYDALALHHAVENGHKEMVQLLIDNNADVNIVNYFGLAPLQVAIQHDNTEIAQLLIDKGADINSGDSCFGYIPLHVAILTNHIETVPYMLSKNATILAKDKAGKTALDAAQPTPFYTPEKVASKIEVAQLLKKYSQLVEAANSNPTKNTLHKAIKGGYITLVKQLLSTLKPTAQQIDVLHKVIQHKHKQTKNSAYKKIGQLLRSYLLRLKTVVGAITANAKSYDIELPEDIITAIVAHINEDKS